MTFSLYKKDDLTITDTGWSVKEGKSAYDTVTTDENGKAQFPSTKDGVLAEGQYYLVENSAPEGYKVNATAVPILVDDELIKVSLSLYDTDGLEGLYVPGSQFRETTKDVASGAMQSNMNIDQSGANNSFSQWGMQAVTNAYQKTSNAISKAIKKNKVKLKYGTFVYLVNGKEKRK